MHYLTTPGTKHDHSIWGPSLPHKLGEPLLSASPIDYRSDFWGIYIVEGLNWTLIVVLMVVCAILGVVTSAIYWAITTDGQTALAIGAYAGTLQAMAFTLFIVMKSNP